jgi:general secretion pathway protein L
VLLLTPVENAPPGAPAQTPWRWAQSQDGQRVARQGQGQVSELPADAECVLVVPPARLSWQRVTLPKVAPARLRAALDGLLEEQLLDEPALLHYALAPGARPGQAERCWVAICNKAWLKSQLQALEQTGRPAGRIIPAASPQAGDSLWLESEGEQGWCIASGPQGLLVLPLQAPAGDGQASPTAPAATRQWLAALQPDAAAGELGARADAASLAVAEACWPNLKWNVAPAPERWLQQLRQGWNLAQFDLRLSARQGRGQWLPRAWRTLARDPAWRPVRWSLGALLGVQLIGLNALAWQEHRSLQAQQDEMGALLNRTFPQVRLVLDPPRQMRAELDQLRQQQGDLGAGDLESLLNALGSAGRSDGWQRLEFSPGQARLVGPAPAGEELQRLQGALRTLGWQGDPAGQEWRLSWERK